MPQIILKFIPWSIALWILIYSLAIFGKFLSPIIGASVFIVGLAIALCCVYALLPTKYRYAPIETWLGYKTVAANRQSKKK